MYSLVTMHCRSLTLNQRKTLVCQFHSGKYLHSSNFKDFGFIWLLYSLMCVPVRIQVLYSRCVNGEIIIIPFSSLAGTHSPLLHPDPYSTPLDQNHRKWSRQWTAHSATKCWSFCAADHRKSLLVTDECTVRERHEVPLSKAVSDHILDLTDWDWYWRLL